MRLLPFFLLGWIDRQDPDLPSLLSDLSDARKRPQAAEQLTAMALRKDIRADLEAGLKSLDPDRAEIVKSIVRVAGWRWLLSDELFTVLDQAIGFPKLVDTIQAGPPEKRRELVESIAYLGDPGLIPFLKHWQSMADPEFRPWPLLVRAVCLDREALPDLIPLLLHGDRVIMGNAYALLYMMGDASLVEALKPLLQEKGDARMRAYYLLDKLAPKEVESIAKELVKEARDDLRFSGARTLSKLKDPAAIEPIVAFIKKEQKPETVALLMQWLKPYETDEILGLYSGMLEHQEAVIAKLAVDAAKGLPPKKSVALFLKALTHWSEDTVAAPAIDELLKIDPAEWKNAARAMLKAPVDVHRANAAMLIGRAGDAESKETLETLTGDRSPRVQMRALEALSRIDMPRAIPIAERLFASSDLHLRLAAASVLSQGDKDRAAPVLKKMTETGVEFEKGFALRTLHAIQHPDAEAIARKFFKEESESVKLVALSTLVEKGTEDALERTLEFVPQTQQLTSYVVWLVEQNFTQARHIPRFAQELKRKEGDLKSRMLAAIWLGFFAGAEARQALLPGLEDPDIRVRVTVALALARGGETDQTVPALLELAKNAEARDTGELWIALGWTRDARAREALLQAVTHPPADTPTCQIKAMEGLGVFGDPLVLPTVRRYLMARSDALRDAALFAAGRLGDPVARRRFFRRVDDCLKGPDNTRPAWMGEMIFQLGQIKGDESMKLLQAVLKGPDPTLKMKAIAALQEIGSAEAVELLRGTLEDGAFVGGQYTPIRYIREVALKSLGKLTDKKFAGTIDEQIEAWKKWWESEGRSSYKKP